MILQNIPDLVAFWDFQEPEGEIRVSKSTSTYKLQEQNGTIPRISDGIFGDYSAQFGNGAWLEISRENIGELNIHGIAPQITVVAWIKRFDHPENNCEAIAGIWNEYQKRQYCLFINLAIHQSSEQVCGHISGTGGATPGHRYCMDAAIGNTPVSLNQWQCIAMTYDGEYIKSYLNGKLDIRENLNPYHYPFGIFNGGNDGGSFTVGAVARPINVQKENKESPDVGNLFHGLLGGLAIFNRTLLIAELKNLAELTKP